MHVGNGGAGGLHERLFRAQQQGAEDKISEGQHDIEVLVHVAVVEEMVTVELAEPMRLLDTARFWQVHAPMDVFVEAVIKREGGESAKRQTPETRKVGNDRKWNDADHDQNRSVPPSHRNRLLVLFMLEVVGLIRFEDLMMDDSMRVKRIAKLPDRAVHHILVECPFEKGRENDADGEAD